MRRASKKQAISPQQLKHFAIAAVAVTCLLALFASGEDWGAKAQVDAVQAKNELAAADAKQQGAKKVLNSVASKPAAEGGFGDSAGVGPMGGGEAQPVTAAPVRSGSDRRGPPPMQGTVRVPRDAPGSGAPVTDPRAKGFIQRGPVDKDRAKQIEEASRARSGSPEASN